jgi:hypothetical protein
VLAAWLLVLGSASFVVGIHDAGVGDEISVRLVGTLVLLGALVLIGGGIGLLVNSPRGQLLATVACLLGVALGVMLTLSQLASDGWDGNRAMLFAWVAIALASGLGVFVLRGLLPGAWRELRVVASLVGVGVVISVAQFWYGSIYLPASAPPSLTLSVTLEPVRTTSTRLTLRGTVTIKNTSSTRVNTLASFVAVRDGTIDPDRDPSADFSTALLDTAKKEGVPGGGEVARMYSGDPSEALVQFSKLFPEETYFESGETVTVPLTVFVQRHRFQVVTADVDVSFARASLKLDSEHSHPDATGLITSTPILPGGWIRDLTRSDRYVHTTWTAEPSGIAVEVAFSPSRNPPEPKTFDKAFDERLQRFYGYSTANGAFQLPLSADKQR